MNHRDERHQNAIELNFIPMGHEDGHLLPKRWGLGDTAVDLNKCGKSQLRILEYTCSALALDLKQARVLIKRNKDRGLRRAARTLGEMAEKLEG